MFVAILAHVRQHEIGSKCWSKGCYRPCLFDLRALCYTDMKRARESATLGASSSAEGIFEPRKGGVRQRARRAADAKKATQEPSSLTELLLTLWCWGNMSPQTIQKIAARFKHDIELAQQDRLNTDEVDFLASLGSHGRYPAKCHKDLSNKINAGSLRQAAVPFSLPLRSSVSSLEVMDKEQLFFLPHLVFATVHATQPQAWSDRILGQDGLMAKFWHDMQDSPQYESHPVASRADHKKRCIPISVHGDGVPVSGIGRAWGLSTEVVSWTSLLGAGSTLDITWFIFSMLNKLEAPGRATPDRVWQIIVWSLFWMWRGVHPDVDPFGVRFSPTSSFGRRALTPLANGFYTCLWIIRGDLDFYRKTLRLESYNARLPCIFCPCNSTPGDPMEWTEFRPGRRAWLESSWTADLWRATHPNAHALFSLPGVSVMTVAADWMHNKHLGTDQWFYGSVVQYLVYHVMPGINSEYRPCLDAQLSSAAMFERPPLNRLSREPCISNKAIF